MFHFTDMESKVKPGGMFQLVRLDENYKTFVNITNKSSIYEEIVRNKIAVGLFNEVTQTETGWLFKGGYF